MGKCDTAGAEYQGSNTGCIDSVGTAEEILAEIRQLVCVLPGNNAECGREDECTDDLNRKCANLAGCKEDTRLALAQISDGNLFVEAKKGFAKNMVAGFIKLNGKTIGAVANATAVYDENGEKAESFEAALTARGCNKAAEFVNFCDAFDIPVLSLVNVEGFGNTECSEKNLPKAMARMTAAFAGATVPKVNVIIGNAYGSAYVMMNSKSIGADLVYAWEGSKVGMMDAALAAKIMYEGKPADVIAEKTKAYQKLQSSVETAARRGQVDLIIAPEDTRKYAAAAFEMLYTKGAGEPVKKHAAK